MTTTDLLIRHYTEEAKLFCSPDQDETAEVRARMLLTAGFLKEFRDTLISIANCRAGMASLAAQNALEDLGFCAHSSQKFVKEESLWHCLDCDASNKQRMEQFA